jgi:hypothetical protein
LILAAPHVAKAAPPPSAKEDAPNPLDEFARLVKPYHHIPMGLVDGKRSFERPDAKNLKPQAHSGDVIEHMKWTALLWSELLETKDTWVEGVYKGSSPSLPIIASFLHDIGKTGDCAYRCIGGDCWFDGRSAYRDDIPGRRVSTHSVRGADIIVGRRPFFTECPTLDELKTMMAAAPADDDAAHTRALHAWTAARNARFDIDVFFKALGINDADRNVLALSTYMHWEFGRLNIGAPLTDKKGMFLKYKKYVDTFVGKARELKVTPTAEVLKLCISISVADVRGNHPPKTTQHTCTKAIELPAGDPDRDVLRYICEAGCAAGSSHAECMKERLLKMEYPHEDSWKKYKMDVNGAPLRVGLLDYFESYQKVAKIRSSGGYMPSMPVIVGCVALLCLLVAIPLWRRHKHSSGYASSDRGQTFRSTPTAAEGFHGIGDDDDAMLP